MRISFRVGLCAVASTAAPAIIVRDHKQPRIIVIPKQWGEIMNDHPEDAGLLAVLMERTEKQRLPRALALKEKVDRGELLDSFDIDFLEEVFATFRENKALIDRHPEYQDMVAQLASIYAMIMEKATENEKTASPD